MEIILIAAMSANRVIGRDNNIPWHIPSEQARFKEITMGYSLLMGRKTWQSIGRPLPGRRNIVVTRNTGFQAKGCEVVHSLKEGLKAGTAAEGRKNGKIFIIGGAQLYSLTLGKAHTLILTRLEQEIDGDAFFPEFSCPPFQLVATERIIGTISYRIETYERMH